MSTQQAHTRHGQLIAVKPEKLEEYMKLHADVWPAVEQRMYDSNMRNFSIYSHVMPADGRTYLFMYYEYIGTDFAADMAAMAADETTQKWWSLTDPCQDPLPNRKEGEWWASMQEVVHHC